MFKFKEETREVFIADQATGIGLHEPDLLEYWSSKTGRIPYNCKAKNCCKRATVGTPVMLNEPDKTSVFIIPFCEIHAGLKSDLVELDYDGELVLHTKTTNLFPQIFIQKKVSI